MKKLLVIVVLGLLLSTNAYAKKGSGELKLSKQIMTNFMMYLYGTYNPKYSAGANKKNKPLLMVVSKDGYTSMYYYCAYEQCASANYVYKAIRGCEKESNGSPCFLFARERKIVWDNGVDVKSKSRRIKRKLLKEPYKIAQIVQDLGFYDGDISELPGIDYETAEVDDQKKITGETKKVEIKKKKPKITKKKETKKIEKKEEEKVVKKYSLEGKRSLALSWDGYSDLIAGTVEFSEADYKGILNLALPNNDGTCEGSYSLQADGKGTWQISCTNNMGAAGTLKWIKDGGVTGIGRDHNDKKVKFTVSKQS